MNRGMYDDDHDVPGHGPTVILAHDDEVDVPPDVEARLRRRPLTDEDEAVWRRAAALDRSRPDCDCDDEPPAMAPVYSALATCVGVQVLVTCMLVALRVGGALDWDWGWVLAPLWVPSTVATVVVTVLGIALAALDERDASRRRAA